MRVVELSVHFFMVKSWEIFYTRAAKLTANVNHDVTSLFYLCSYTMHTVNYKDFDYASEKSKFLVHDINAKYAYTKLCQLKLDWLSLRLIFNS